MNARTSRTAKVTIVVVVSGLIAVSSFAPITGTATADEHDPETPEEFLATFQTLEGTEAFERYSEFEIIRSQAVQDAQVGEFTPAKEERLTHILELLRTVDEAVEMQDTGAYEDALTLGDEAAEIIDDLRTVERGEEYALLAEIALDRFYAETAETLLAEAEETDTTPTRIDLLSQAAASYNRAGETEQFGQLSLRVDETEQRFQTDLDTINESSAELDAFLDECDDCDSAADVIMEEGLSVFGLYSDSLGALSSGKEALSMAERHGLSDVEGALNADYEAANENSQTLAVASVTMLVGYSTVVGLVVALVTWRLMLWKRDFTDSQHGDVVLMGEMLNA